jgi:hypothetical protein
LRSLWGASTVGGSWEQSREGLGNVTRSVDPTTSPILADELQRGVGVTAVVDSHDADRIYASTVAGVYVSNGDSATCAHPKSTTRLIKAIVLTPLGTLWVKSDAGVFTYVVRPTVPPVFLTAPLAW